MIKLIESVRFSRLKFTTLDLTFASLEALASTKGKLVGSTIPLQYTFQVSSYLTSQYLDSRLLGLHQ